ncbi:hypothetical protein Bbelb_202530 [Branchiostoma belcheri]|nr:hypothetical protein Bbelb_202530 [Branchiostoma belcheri]
MAAFGSPLNGLFLLTLMFCLFTGGAPEPVSTPEPVASPQARCLCSWYAWGSWSACSKPCGNAGTRVRYRTGYCCSKITFTQTCNRFCYNNGTAHSNGCNCTSQYEGRCCDVYKGSRHYQYAHYGGSIINISQTTNQSTVVGLSVSFAIIGLVLIGVAVYCCVLNANLFLLSTTKYRLNVNMKVLPL